MSRRRRLALAALVCLGAGLACRDALGPGARAIRAASLSIAAPEAGLVAPDGSRLEVDRGTVRITRTGGSVALERSFDFPAGQQSVQVELDIPLSSPTEQFTAGIRLFNATTLLFQTSGPLTVSFGTGNPSPAFPPPTYAGPGATVTSLTIAPRDTILTFGDSVRFRSTAQAGAQQVQAFFVNLTTSDPQVTVGTTGFVRAPSRRGSVTVQGTVLGTSVTDQTTLLFVPRPTVVTRTAGDAQSATVATALPQPLGVVVTAADGLGVANVPVVFAALAAGASVGQTTVRTDANGVASTTATLGTVAGAQGFTATVAGLPPVTFTQTANAGVLAALGFAGAPPGAIRAEAPFTVVVEGRDALGNATTLSEPVAVAFGTRPGTATLTGPLTASPVGATATFTGLRASRPGTGGTLVFTSGALSLSSGPMNITVGPPNTLAVVAGAPPTSAVVSGILPDSLVYRLTDDLSVPLAGVAVSFTLGGRVGNVVRGSATTDTAGLASPGRWTLAALAGANTLSPSAGPATGPTVSVTGTAGAAATLAIDAGNAQSATVGTAVAVAPRVLVTDANGNPVAGVNVTFAVASGGGSVTGSSATTDANGRAGVGSWTLGTTAGANTLSASSGPLSPVSFTATGTPGAPTVMDYVAPTNGVQVGQAGQAVAIAPSVRVRDAFSNPVPGVTVTFAVTAGGGSVTGATPVTDAAGIATVGGWTLGPSGGTNTLRATSGALVRDFTATTEALVATRLVVLSGGNQRVRRGQPFATPIVVQAQTAGGTPVPGERFFYSLIAPDSSQVGSVGGFLTTDASGNATIEPFAVSDEPGPYSVTVVGSGPVTGTSAFLLVVGDPARLLPATQQSITVAAGAAVPSSASVTVYDANESRVPDAPVTMTWSAPDVVAIGGPITGTILVRRTDSDGVAQLGGSAPGTPGRYLVQASLAGGTSVILVLNVTGQAQGSQRVLRPLANDGARGPAGTTLGDLPSVVLTDALGGVVVGTTVTFERVDPLGNRQAAGSATTNPDGVAVLPGPFALSATPGLHLIIASAPDAAPVTLTAAGWGAPAAFVDFFSQVLVPQQVGTSASVSATLVDALGTPIRDATVTVTNTQPDSVGGIITLPTQTFQTNANGRVTVSFQVGTNPGPNTMTFTAGGASRLFTITGTIFPNITSGASP
ncbi:MAG: beta strand repeat-containing protein [Gemmatimonadota bacterium]